MPFRKRKQMSSSERTKLLSCETMTKTVELTKTSNYNKNSFFDKTMSHSDLLKYTKGYFHYKCCCYSQTENVNTANQGKDSYIDLSGVTMKNECRNDKGLITPRGKLNPKPQEKSFSYPTPIKKTYSCCF